MLSLNAMTGFAATPDPQALLAQEGFMRAVARSLLHDDDHVDDVVQEAWLKAVERPPTDAGALRGWLGTVVRNLSRNENKAKRARRQLEEAAAAPEAIPSPDTIREREHLRRIVVDLVLGLPEPYRGTLLLRFFEDLQPKEIARRMEVPSATVRTRLARGLQMVRGSLDAEHGGDRRSWCLALIPLARPKWVATAVGTSGGLVISGLVVKKTTAVLAALLLVCSTAFFLVDPFAGDPLELQPVGEPISRAASGSVGVPSRQTFEEAPRERVAARDATDGRSSRKKPGTPIRRLLTAKGRPVAEVAYWFTPEMTRLPRDNSRGEIPPDPEEHETTSAEGRFEIPKGSRGLLWFRIDDSLAAVYRVRALLERRDPEVRLPRRHNLVVECGNRPPAGVWQVLVYPMYHSGRSEPSELEVSEVVVIPNRNLGYLVQHMVRRATSNKKISVSLLERQPFRVYAEGQSFSILDGEAENVLRPPTIHRLQATRPRATVPVEVVNRFGRIDPVGGKVVFGPVGGTWRNDQPLSRGQSTLGYVKLEPGEEYGVWVLVDDGEVFERKIVISGPVRQPVLRFYRGDGVAPVQLEIDPVRAKRRGAVKRMVIEKADGEFSYGSDDLSLFSDSRWDAFGYQKRTDLAYRLIGLPKNWRKLWVLCVDGRIATAENTLRRRVRGRWATARALRPLSLRGAVQTFGARDPAKARIKFEVQLESSRGEKRWVALDGESLDPKRSSPWPVWRKWSTDHVPCRMIVFDHDRTQDVTSRR